MIMCNLDRQNHWKFENNKENLFTEFGLYCDKMYIISAGTSIYFLGFFLSVSFLSSLVDSLGRKLSTLLFMLSFILTLVFQLLSTSIFQVMIGRFVLGALHGGISISMHVLFFEFTSASFATLMTMVTSAGYSVGGGLAGLVAMGSSHWQQTMILPILCWIVISTSFCIMVPESPHWLFAKGHTSKAMDSLNKVATINGSKHLNNVRLISVSGKGSSLKKEGFKMLWQVPFLRYSLVYLAFTWFTVSLCYYGLEFNAGSLGNEYVVMILMGCFDTPFRLYMYVFAQRQGRQVACQVYLAAALICLVCTGFPVTESILITENLSLKTFLVVLGRAFGGSVFALLYVYTTEILPTLVRSVGISFCSTVARIGSLLAPLVILVNEVSPLIIYIIIVICIIVSMRVLRNIPETAGKPLPNSLQDCRKLFDKNIEYVKKIESV